MRKQIKKKKTIEVEEEGIFCDLCGNEMPENVFYRVQVVGNDSVNKVETATTAREICSSECLQKNLKGLVIQTTLKDIPSVRSKLKTLAEEEKKYPMKKVTYNVGPVGTYKDVAYEKQKGY